MTIKANPSLGFEPKMTGSKPVVIPFHQEGIKIAPRVGFEPTTYRVSIRLLYH